MDRTQKPDEEKNNFLEKQTTTSPNSLSKDNEVAGNSSTATLSQQMALDFNRHPLFKSVPKDGKLRALANFTLPVTSGVEEQGCQAVSPASSDKTDNHDRDLTFCPDTPDMLQEEERLKTFDKWPVSFLRPQQLAQNGFYYLGRGDEVRCAFCKVEIMRWEEGDDPAADHRRWAPQCPFLRRLAESDGGRDECGTRPARPALNLNAGVVLPGPKHVRYASHAARLKTFDDWPRSLRQKPEELADAGFFYTGQGDKTKCFYCDGGLKDWEDDDVPWEQHARWFTRCAYVQLVKGREYVQKITSTAATIPEDKSESPLQSPAPVASPEPVKSESSETPKSVDDNKLCKICFEEEMNVCFLPCGHVVACAKCALSTDKCPLCRRHFHNAVRLYFS